MTQIEEQVDLEDALTNEEGHFIRTHVGCHILLPGELVQGLCGALFRATGKIAFAHGGPLERCCEKCVAAWPTAVCRYCGRK